MFVYYERRRFIPTLYLEQCTGRNAAGSFELLAIVFCNSHV